jgi:excisionase family DNA binding protein
MPEYLSRKVLAARLCVCEDTISQLAREGTIPFAKVGRRYVFDWSAVVKALRGQGRGGAR